MKPITIQYHYNEIRNAYYGPESWYEYTSKPWLTLIDQGYKGKIPPGYFRVKPLIYTFQDVYAYWPIFPWLKAGYMINSRWWQFLGFLHRHGLIHSTKPRSMLTRFRDIRPGRGR